MPKKKKVEEVVEEVKEEVEEEAPVEEKEEVVEETLKEEPVVETEKKKGNPLGPVVVVLVAIIVLLIGYLIFIHPAVLEMMKEKDTPTEEKEKKEETKEEQKEENNKEEKETTPSQEISKTTPVVAVGNNKRIGLFDENYNLVWSHDTEDYIPYSDVSAAGEYAYYGVHQDNKRFKIYRVNIKTKNIEDLNIEVNDVWHYDVDGNLLLITSLYDYYLINLDTKTQEQLEIHGNNATAFINETVYYTDKDTQNLRAYNIKTKEDKVLEENGRIVAKSSSSILYVNSDNKYYLYNGKEKSKTFIRQGGEYALQSGDYNIILTLYKNTVYAIKDKALYTIKEDNLTKIADFNLKEDESIQEILVLSDNKFLLRKYIDNGEPCTSDTCGPTGDFKNVVFDKNKKELKEVGNDDWGWPVLNLYGFTNIE